MTKLLNLTGQRFGRLVAIDHRSESSGSSKRKYVIWRCLCDCGNETTVRSSVLMRGHTMSCKCLRDELPSKLFKTHGRSRTRLYRIWTHVLSRCRNPNEPEYHNYGGRGISIFPDWEWSFESFAAYVGEPPSKLHSIDRYPNYNGNYEPGNVRWATAEQQCRNRRGLILVQYQDRQMCLAEASEITGVPYGTIYSRLFKHRWPLLRALTTPPRKKAA